MKKTKKIIQKIAPWDQEGLKKSTKENLIKFYQHERRERFKINDNFDSVLIYYSDILKQDFIMSDGTSFEEETYADKLELCETSKVILIEVIKDLQRCLTQAYQSNATKFFEDDD